MRIHGKVIDTIPKDRIIKLLSSDRIYYLYFQRKDFREFGPYFFENPYIFVEVSNERRKIENYMVYIVTMFIRIVQPSIYTMTRQRKVYFDMEVIKKGVKKLINKPHNKLFIDLEFTMPPLYQSMPYAQEIIQYGIVVEDKQGKIIFEDSSLVKPSRPYNLNKNTLRFLSLKREDFDNACTYRDFYKVLSICLSSYNPKIYVWGKSDILAMENSFILNHIKSLGIRENHINLMQVIKNYYNYKDEIGLFQTYQNMSNSDLGPQQHNALEDAMITREIFNMFKIKINEE